MARNKARADAPRYAAVAALVQMHGGLFSAEAVQALDASALNAQGRAFAGALFFGAAERAVTLDWLLAPHLKKPAAALDAEVRAILECGLYQMLYMRVPPSAAVNESVKLARAFGKSSAAGLVNAVLRKAAPQAQSLRAAQPAAPDLSRLVFESEVERVCVTASVGRAVAKAVMQALPEEYDAFLAACFSSGEVCLHANPLKTTREELAQGLAQAGVPVRAGVLPQALYAQIPGGVGRQAGFARGLYHVQGEASQVACACLQAAPGEKVLDLCAAPGGKSAAIAGALGGGAGLCSCDVHVGRLALVRETFARLGIAGARVLQNDAAVWNEELCGQDKVLCDVPCSGLGTLAQRPDLRTVGEERFAPLPARQLAILCTAARYVNRGGRLVYSTCTVRPRENAQVVRAFLARGGAEFRLMAPPVAPAGAVREENMMTLLPHRTGMDGFFVATLERL